MEFQVRTGTPWHTHHETYETVTDSIIWQKWIDDPALVIGEAWTACWASLRLSQGPQVSPTANRKTLKQDVICE